LTDLSKSLSMDLQAQELGLYLVEAALEAVFIN
jgi:hypothetical protein